MCVSAWEKVGAATKDGITQWCLKDKNKKVKRSVGDGDEEADKLHPLIQTANDLAVHALVQAGYDGELLRAKIREDKHNEAEKSITEPNTAARVAAPSSMRKRTVLGFMLTMAHTQQAMTS